MEFVPRFFDPPLGSYYLFGPRGTGKSAWIRRCYRDCLLIDLLQPDIRRRFQARPERIRDLVHGQPEKRIIVIDEVQRVPELLSAVHALIEEKRGWRFILTGSSARELRRAGVDLMAGRAVMRTLHPFMASELGEKFDLETSLNLGLLPLVWDAENRRCAGELPGDLHAAGGAGRRARAESRGVQPVSRGYQLLPRAGLEREQRGS